MHGKKNVMCILRQREYSHVSSCRENFKIIKNLVCAGSAKFKRIWEKHSKYPIRYEGGKLYFDNYRLCLIVSGLNNCPQKVYKLPSCPSSEKIEDCLLCQVPLEKVPLRHKGYRASFLAVTAHNWLIRYDLHTGEMLQQVYLSPRYKFRHLLWDIDQSSFVIKSTRSKQTAFARQAGIPQSLVIVLTIFTIFPLEFIAMFEIDKNVFGANVIDASVSQGALIVMHQGGMVRLHSLEEVLAKGTLFTTGLEEDSEAAGGVVGSYPTGLPLNVKIQEAPPVLFEVRCAEHNVHLGGFPWHYIISPHGSQGYFHVYSLENGLLADNGVLDLDTLSVEPDKCIFHADESGRILHVGATEIRVLKLEEGQGESRRSVVLDFAVDLTKRRPKQLQQGDKITFTSSGRAVRRMRSFDDELMDTPSETVQVVDYENELELLMITGAHQTGDSCVGTVYLHDNLTGEMVKDIPLEEPWKEFCEHQVWLDLDTIVHSVKGPTRKFSCYVYKLDRRLDEMCEKKDSSSSQRSRRRRYLEESVSDDSLIHHNTRTRRSQNMLDNAPVI